MDKELLSCIIKSYSKLLNEIEILKTDIKSIKDISIQQGSQTATKKIKIEPKQRISCTEQKDKNIELQNNNITNSKKIVGKVQKKQTKKSDVKTENDITKTNNTVDTKEKKRNTKIKDINQEITENLEVNKPIVIKRKRQQKADIKAERIESDQLACIKNTKSNIQNSVCKKNHTGQATNRNICAENNITKKVVSNQKKRFTKCNLIKNADTCIKSSLILSNDAKATIEPSITKENPINVISLAQKLKDNQSQNTIISTGEESQPMAKNCKNKKLKSIPKKKNKVERLSSVNTTKDGYRTPTSSSTYNKLNDFFSDLQNDS